MFCNIFCSLKFKLNVFLQTPDPRDSVDMSYEIPEQQDQPQRAGAAAQDPDPGQGPQALHSPPGQLDLLAPSSPSIRSCRLQPKLLQGNICYIFHNIFLSVVTLYDIQAAVLFLYNDIIQAPEVSGPSCQWPCDGCNDGVVSHLLSENCKFLLYRNSFILSRGSES